MVLCSVKDGECRCVFCASWIPIPQLMFDCDVGAKGGLMRDEGRHEQRL